MGNNLLTGLIEPLQYSFMQRSLIEAIIVGIICAVVGTYLMVQRLALLGDAISHSVLPGLAIAFIGNFNLLLGALLASMVSTLLINLIRNRSPIKEDAAMGIVFSAFFALGITLITLIQKNNKIDLNHFLFGNILGVTAADIRDTLIIAVIVLLTVLLLYKELLFYTFDKIGAQAAGLPVNLLDLGLMLLIGLTIVASLQAVGVCQKRQKRYPEALQNYQKLLELDEKNLIAITNIGLIHYEQGDLNLASKLLRI